MPPVAAQIVAATFVMLMIAGCVTVWAIAIGRWRRGQPVIPYQPRRPAPWHGIDVAIVITMFMVTAPLLMQLTRSWWHAPAPVAAPARIDHAETEHPLERVLVERPSVSAVLVCVALAVVVAPVTEELLFRLLLQGWLESVERRWRRRLVALRQMTAGLLPISAVALLFAAVHYREPERGDVTTIVRLQNVQVAASLITVIVLVWWLRFAAGATMVDLGIVRGKLMADIKLGLLAFVAVTGPIYAIWFVAQRLLPADVVTDPIPIFGLAVALGVLYYRTHRIVPAIALHMAFNTTGVVLALTTTLR
ncbi:MAG: CPBP family intramembrane metalloprotease [Planctomycetaceae bacterium]|nr:CPBP family intramembrane metalloprotease [Planctomycetaceae bacterium]